MFSRQKKKKEFWYQSVCASDDNTTTYDNRQAKGKELQLSTLTTFEPTSQSETNASIQLSIIHSLPKHPPTYKISTSLLYIHVSRMVFVTGYLYTTPQHKIRLRSTFISYLLLQVILICLSFHEIASFSAPDSNYINRLTSITTKNALHQYNVITPSTSLTATLPSNHQHHIPDYDANDKTKSYTWLDQGTNDILDTKRIPIGKLTEDDVESISNLMANWAKRKSEHSALQVEQLLKRVVDDHNAGNSAVKVNTKMYTMAIDSWARTGGKQAAERATDIHRGMVEVYKQTGDLNIMPSTISYNAVINAWSKSGGDEEAALRAEGILEEMLDEWRRTRKGDVKKDAVDVSVNVNRNLKVSDGKASQKVDENDEDLDEEESIVKPDVISFTSVIDTWARSGMKNGAAKAMHLLKKMEQLYVEEGQLGMKPNGTSYCCYKCALDKRQCCFKCY